MNTAAELDAKLSTLEGGIMTAKQGRKRKNRLWASGILIVILFVALGSSDLLTQSYVAAGDVKQQNDWPDYGRDAGGSRYSPLAQINRGNVGQLKVAWTYRTGAGEGKAVAARNATFESTPILVDGLLYLTTPYNRVIALDPATGVERWSYDPRVPLDRGYSELTSRGASAWPAPNEKRANKIKAARRIFVATIDAR